MQSGPNETGTDTLAHPNSRRFSDEAREPVPVSLEMKKGLLLPLAVILTAMAMLAIILSAPTERTMGDAQRIVYIHVAVAWCGLAGFLIMAGAGMMYLRRRNLAWDHWAQAAAELGWLAATLTLITGSIWAHAAWNTWWSWDPRLATTFVLWAINSACLVVRSGLEDPHRRARIGAVLAILGAIDLPLVVMATRWFRGIHRARRRWSFRCAVCCSSAWRASRRCLRCCSCGARHNSTWNAAWSAWNRRSICDDGLQLGPTNKEMYDGNVHHRLRDCLVGRTPLRCADEPSTATAHATLGGLRANPFREPGAVGRSGLKEDQTCSIGIDLSKCIPP